MAQKKDKKGSQRSRTRKNEDHALQIIEDNPVPVVVENEIQDTTSLGYKIVTGFMFFATVVIWFLVGQKVFLMTTQDMWLDGDPERKVVLPVSDEIVATIGGRSVFLSDVKKFANSIPQLKEIPFEMVYPQLLETMIDKKVMLRAAQQAGTEDLPDVKKAIQESKDQIIAQAYLNKLLEDSVTEEQLNSLYQKELENFKPVEEIRARHILLKTKQEAKDVIVQLKAGADFELIAEKYSLDKNSPKGDLGYFSEDMMIPEFGKKAFALKKGKISQPVKTPFGWHVIEVLDRRMSKAPAFADVKEQLQQVVIEKNIRRILAEERQKLNVVIRRPSLKVMEPVHQKEISETQETK